MDNIDKYTDSSKEAGSNLVSLFDKMYSNPNPETFYRFSKAFSWYKLQNMNLWKAGFDEFNADD